MRSIFIKNVLKVGLSLILFVLWVGLTLFVGDFLFTLLNLPSLLAIVVAGVAAIVWIMVSMLILGILFEVLWG